MTNITENNGPSEADTPRLKEENQQNSAENVDISEIKAKLPDAIQDLAIAMGTDADGQIDLLSGSPDLDDQDVLARATNSFTSKRRGAGRPKGSANRRNGDVFDYLGAMGHRDPAITLSLIQTADTQALAVILGCKPKEALSLQIDAAKTLMPFAYSKKPQDLNVNSNEMHIMVVGDLGVQRADGGNDQEGQIIDLDGGNSLHKGE